MPDAQQLAAVEDAIAGMVGASMVTRWVVVAEVFDESGEAMLGGFTSPGLPPWVASGMLQWEAGTREGQPAWTVDDD